MATKDRPSAEHLGDAEKRIDAANNMLHVVFELSGVLGKIEQYAARLQPGRLSLVRATAESMALRAIVEEQADQVATLSGELARRAAEVVKVRPIPKICEETAAEVPEPDKTRAALAKAGQSKS